MDSGQSRPLGLRVENGMLLEVLLHDKQVQFRGRVSAFDGESISLVEATGGEVPPVMYNTEVKLRGRLNDGRAVVYHGVIVGSSPEMWKIGQLTNWYTSEKREYYRQNITVACKVQRTKRMYPDKSPYGDNQVDCKLLDVSGGGVLLSCSESYDRGDQIYVTNAALDPDAKPFSFYCTVKRVEEAKYAFLYGCEFEDLRSKEQDRLIQAVFRLQREEAKRLRGR